jgi:hypothetical protein
LQVAAQISPCTWTLIGNKQCEQFMPIEHYWLNIVGYNMSDVLENYVGSGLILFKIFIQSAGLNERLLT